MCLCFGRCVSIFNTHFNIVNKSSYFNRQINWHTKQHRIVLLLLTRELSHLCVVVFFAHVCIKKLNYMVRWHDNKVNWKRTKVFFFALSGCVRLKRAWRACNQAKRACFQMHYIMWFWNFFDSESFNVTNCATLALCW